MKDITALLKTAESHLAKAREALDEAKTEECVETLSSVQNLALELKSLDERLSEKKVVLIKKLARLREAIRRYTRQSENTVAVSSGKSEATLGAMYVFGRVRDGSRMESVYWRFEGFAKSKERAELFWIVCEDAIRGTHVFLEGVPDHNEGAVAQTQKLQSAFTEIKALASLVPEKY